jgi:chromosome segregation ATPase
MARSKNYKRKNVHNLKKSRKYIHLNGGEDCVRTIRLKDDIEVHDIHDDFKKKIFFDIMHGNKAEYRIVWDISIIDKFKNPTNYTIDIHKFNNVTYNFQLVDRPGRGIDFLAHMLVQLMTEKCLNAVLKFIKDNISKKLKDKIFTHIFAKLTPSYIREMYVKKYTSLKKKIYEQFYELLKCKLTKEHPAILRAIQTNITDQEIRNFLIDSTKVSSEKYYDIHRTLVEIVKSCRDQSTVTVVESEEVKKLREEVKHLKEKDTEEEIKKKNKEMIDAIKNPLESEIARLKLLQNECDAIKRDQTIVKERYESRIEALNKDLSAIKSQLDAKTEQLSTEKTKHSREYESKETDLHNCKLESQRIKSQLDSKERALAAVTDDLSVAKKQVDECKRRLNDECAEYTSLKSSLNMLLNALNASKSKLDSIELSTLKSAFEIYTAAESQFRQQQQQQLQRR